MNKIVKFSSVFGLSILMAFVLIVPISAYSDIKELESTYNELVNSDYSSKSKTSLEKSNNHVNITSLSDSDIETLQENNVDVDFYDFFEVFANSDFYDYLSNDSGSIVVNPENNVPILIDGSSDDLVLTINNQKYTLRREIQGLSQNILLIHQSGKEMYLHREIENNLLNDAALNIFEPLAVTIASGYWLTEGPGVKGQTGTWLAVLSIALDAAGWLGKFSHPIVGIIFKSVGTAVTIGSLFYITLYTIKYNSQRSDCRTYIKQRTVYYEYSNYTGHKKTTQTLFHSVRPDYAGGACESY